MTEFEDKNLKRGTIFWPTKSIGAVIVKKLSYKKIRVIICTKKGTRYGVGPADIAYMTLVDDPNKIRERMIKAVFMYGIEV